MLKNTVVYDNYKITSDVDYIIIQAGTQKVNLLKSKLKGVSVVSTTPPIIVLMGCGDEGASYAIKFSTTNTNINGVLQASVAMCEATLKAEIKVGTPEIFLTTLGQTAFNTTWAASATNCRIYEGGNRSDLTGWTFPAGVPTYAAGFPAGIVIIIERIG